jgi:hypothetical protein
VIFSGVFMLLSKNQEEKVRYLYRVDLLIQYYLLLNFILTTTVILPGLLPGLLSITINKYYYYHHEYSIYSLKIDGSTVTGI